VVLDKTGTVTEGTMEVLEADDATLRIAAGLERFSRHPVALAVVREAVRREIPLPRARNVREEAGRGISGEVDGAEWRLVSAGAGLVALEGPEGREGTIRLGDQIRPDARDAVGGLSDLGLRVRLLTGDHRDVAERVSAAAGIGEWEAEMSPDAKAARVRASREAGERVLFAGDGLNDGPALAEADVGVAFGTGAASSILVADGVVGVPSLSPVLAGIRAGRAARRVIAVNQIRSIAYNVVAVALAAAGWVNPLVAAVLMPLSSGLVIAGAAGVEGRVRRMEGGSGGPAGKRAPLDRGSAGPTGGEGTEPGPTVPGTGGSMAASDPGRRHSEKRDPGTDDSGKRDPGEEAA
jgi:cation transport ATPase